MSADPNDMMLELFRSEVESHSETLTSSLLALEQQPAETSTLDRMMRAAHSIKGAARIVRVDPAADVAHVMEDCFVAAQKGRLTITPDDVDVLLRGVDLLVKISAATRDSQTDWGSFQTPVAVMVGALRDVLEGRPRGAGGAAASAKTAELSASASATASAPNIGRQSAVVACPAWLNAQAAERARMELLSALESGATEFAIDLGATTELDDRGLAFLAAAQRHLAERSLAFRFHPVSKELRTVLQLTGLADPDVSGAGP